MKAIVFKHFPTVFILGLAATYAIAYLAFGRVGVRVLGFATLLITLGVVFDFLRKAWAEYWERSPRF